MNTGTLHLREILWGHKERINGAIALNAHSILSWSDDTTLRVWHIDHTNRDHLLNSHNAQVNHALRLPVEQVVSTAYDGSICIWDPRIGTLLQKIEKPDSTFMGTAYWKPDHVVSWDLEGNLIVWDISSGKAVSTLAGACHNYTLTKQPFLLLQDKDIAVVWPSIDLEFWYLQTGECKKSVMEHGDAVEGARVLPNGQFVTWSNDCTLKIWTYDGNVVTTLEGHKQYIRNAFVLDKEHLVSWADDTTIRIWNFVTAEPDHVFTNHESHVQNVWPVAKDVLLSQSLDGRCFVWNRTTGETLSTFEVNVYGSNGGTIVLESYFLHWVQSTVELWDLQSGLCLQSFNAHDKKVVGAMTFGSKNSVTWSEDRTLKVWDTV